MKKQIYNLISDSITTKQKMLSEPYTQVIEKIANALIYAYKNNNKVLLCGNGGSATDAQHIEGELVGRFLRERKGLPALALVSNSATMTSIGNDYGYDEIFRRQIEAFGENGDVLIAITTSGNSKNIITAAEYAKKSGIYIVAFTGRDGGKIKEIADISLIIPSDITARIQECHIMAGHIICELVEKAIFPDE